MVYSELHIPPRIKQPTPSPTLPHPLAMAEYPDPHLVSLCNMSTQSGEEDPNGLPLNAHGAKADKGKNRVGLVITGFAHALEEVSKVGTMGAEKYTDRGFLSVPDGERRYTDAMLRHLLQEETVGPIDSESGLRHMAHVAWNALARLELHARNANSGKTNV